MARLFFNSVHICTCIIKFIFRSNSFASYTPSHRKHTTTTKKLYICILLVCTEWLSLFVSQFWIFHVFHISRKEWSKKNHLAKLSKKCRTRSFICLWLSRTYILFFLIFRSFTRFCVHRVLLCLCMCFVPPSFVSVCDLFDLFISIFSSSFLESVLIFPFRLCRLYFPSFYLSPNLSCIYVVMSFPLFTPVTHSF